MNEIDLPEEMDCNEIASYMEYALEIVTVDYSERLKVKTQNG
jgi:hypothetical protein